LVAWDRRGLTLTNPDHWDPDYLPTTFSLLGGDFGRLLAQKVTYRGGPTPAAAASPLEAAGAPYRDPDHDRELVCPAVCGVLEPGWVLSQPPIDVFFIKLIFPLIDFFNQFIILGMSFCCLFNS